MAGRAVFTPLHRPRTGAGALEASRFASSGLPERRNRCKHVRMKIDEIRNLRDAVRFQPFSLHLAHGRAIPVRHRDFLMTSPSGRTVIVYQPDDSFDIVDVILITSLLVKPSNGRVRRKS
jgi:hypothetical protein